MKKWVSLLIISSILVLTFAQVNVYAEEERGVPIGRQLIAEENIGNALVMADVTFDENDEIILGEEVDVSGIPMPTATVGETCRIIPHAQTLWYGSWSTCKFDVGTSTGTNRGYCAQPQTPTPSGYYTVSKIDGSTEMGKKLKIALMFGENGPWYGESTALFGGCSWNAVYAYLHAMISIIYSGQTNGLTSVQVQAMNGAINEQYNARGNLSILNDYTVYVAYNDKQDIVWLEKVSDQPSKPPTVEILPYCLQVIKANEENVKLQGAEFSVYEDKNCTQEKACLVTDENGIASFQGLEVGKTYYLKEVKAPQGYRISEDHGNEIIYEIKSESNPTENVFECYINGKKHTDISGTTSDRIVTLEIINHRGMEMPETGTHMALILFLCGVGCMSVVLLHSVIKRKDKEKE